MKASIRDVSLNKLAEIISGGGVVVIPTDTIYGLHCVASKKEAVLRVKKLKGRDASKGFILLASDIFMVDGIVSEWPKGARESLSSIWPAPLTAILPAADTVQRDIVHRGRLAVRVPDSQWLRRLIKLVGEPVISTSANRSGMNPLTRIGDIIKSFPCLDFYVSSVGRSSRVPSTVVDFTQEIPRILRLGRYRLRS